MFATNNTDYIGCDYKKFACVKGVIFYSVIVGGLKWSNMEGLHVRGKS